MRPFLWQESLVRSAALVLRVLQSICAYSQWPGESVTCWPYHFPPYSFETRRVSHQIGATPTARKPRDLLVSTPHSVGFIDTYAARTSFVHAEI